MTPQRPDLDQLSTEVRAYIEYLEKELSAQSQDSRSSSSGASSSGATNTEPSELPTTRMVVTTTRSGTIKRTPRHLYSRQRRGGMGVFDLESDDAPELITIADESDRLCVLTDRSRFFTLRVADLAEAPVRAKGQALSDLIPIQQEESIAVLWPEREAVYLHVLSDRGWVRRISAPQITRLAPGTLLEVRSGHQPVAACWSSGEQDIFIISRGGSAIRFDEKRVPFQGGCLGIRLEGDDRAAFITTTTEDGGVFLLSNEGKGTIRQMSGFRANKSPGAAGKVALKADVVVAAQDVVAGQDIFAISRLGKLIRFSADEIPVKTGVVQGVNCMNLRGDEVVAATVSDPGDPTGDAA